MVITETEFSPKLDLDGYVSKEELEARLSYCNDESVKKDQSEWSAQFAARALYLESVLENWDYLDKDDEEKSEVDEMDYTDMLDSLCEDQGFSSVYEDGPESPYSWMVWAKCHEISEFAYEMKEWMDENVLSYPEWCKDSLWFAFFYED